MTCWRRSEGSSEGSGAVSVGGTLDNAGGEEPKTSSRELATVVELGCGWSLLGMAVVLSEWVEVIVVAGERGAEGDEPGESICPITTLKGMSW